ncbi:uncharacterized protein adgrf6 [Coregonus clupeaformis]|uniref:uncharacterized protein adgrf6 n=1 Tax=Coregonus clupeaformis TaxID=59861 RepID=UPI001E1C8DC5|nr:uncharacterized protein adgrf6 [Coregonus clupeaformis]
MIEIELNTTDVTVIDQLRAILRNASYPVRINNLIQITGINISTVCYPNGTGFQCRCEDQYRWSCDQCLSYGKCDDITSDTCGCINAIPKDGQYCQSVHKQNFTACPTTTASPTTVSTVLPTLYEYMIEIELNTTDVTVIDQLRAILRNASYPVRINNLIQITGINISTVCYPNGTGFQCRCEDQYRWSCDQCVSYGKCDDIISDTCGCINAIPPDGQYCQSVHNQISTVPPTLYEYMIEIELNTTDVTVIDQLSAILRNASYPVRINNLIQITGINISTVCYPNGTGFQCRCEDQYRWSCDQCLSYGKCDDITSDTCGCINAIPKDGQLYRMSNNNSLSYNRLYRMSNNNSLSYNRLYRMSNNNSLSYNRLYRMSNNNSLSYNRCEDQYRWSCDQCVSYGKCDDIISDTCGCINAIPPDGQYCQLVHNQISTVPPTLYEYMIEIELNTTDVTVIDQLSAILRNASYPVRINNLIQITGINISTVCYPNGTGFQCRCEDQYRWSCDQCVSYGKCDDITSDTCGCINAIPKDGQYCQSVHKQISTVPPTLYEYMIEIELNTTDVTVIDQLSAILRNASYPVRINNLIQITGINISTVCYPNGTGFQCRCEDQYRWSCDQCVSYGKCDDITYDTCGCINAIPPDGQYCQSVHNQRIHRSHVDIAEMASFILLSKRASGPLLFELLDRLPQDIFRHLDFLCVNSLFLDLKPFILRARPLRVVYNFSTVPPTLYEYMIEIELSTTDVTVIDQLRAILRNASYPVRINNLIQITGINISTVCYPNGTGFQCRCEDQYRWSCDQCVSYGKCDDITSDTCGCINAIPPDGQYCQLVHNQISTVPPTLYEYMIEIKLNTTDITVIDQLRAILRNASYPVRINNLIQITGINISTVCYPNGTGFQCRCEDQYRWSCDQCVSYGKCDDITSDTCGCINAIPPDGQYCQSVHNQISTVPPTLYEYMIEIKLNTTDITVIDQLRAILRNASYPVRINNLIQITGINISTVCYPNGTGFQCRCEDQYRWSCDQCVSYGKCDDITSDTCGCINAIPPDGQYCQSVHNQISTVPPTLYEYMIEIKLNTTDITVIDQLRAILRNNSYPVRIDNLIQITGINISTVCYPNGTGFQCRCEDQYRWSCDQCVSYGKCDDITSDTCGCINAIPPDGQYCQLVHNQISTLPPTLYEYIIEIKLNTTDITVIDQLRAILRNNSYPVRIDNLIQITGINISTVCYPNGTGFQCRCEDQYRWSCDQCVSYGKCDDITSDTCGCINAIPPDGQYCQSVHNQISTVPPTLYEYMIEIKLNTTDITVIDQLRAILRNNSYPVRIDNLIQITGINISTVCYPNGTGFQCRCEDQYRWSCDQCVSYGKCDDITSDTCGCINAIPPDGQYCQSVHNQIPPTLYEYMIEIELSTTDVTVIGQLRAILRNASYPVRINNLIQITGINISTVCYPNGTGFQCRCEDQYRWSCDQCVSYGKCDDITSDTCGCINAIPPDGQYCQSVHNQNFTACPTTTASPTTVSTVPPTLYEYMIEIELNTTDVTVIDQLRAILRNASYPVRINNLIQITGINISTVCYPNGTGFQCRCEDQYRWSCDQCVSYGKCDDITSDTCGCINAIPPDGQYCQSVHNQNFTACPTTTASPTTVSTVPPTLYEYMIEIELNTTDFTVIDQLRAILRNASYPVRINNLIQITGINISTVCYPNGTGFQCRCEDQYRWSCDQCVSYGKCDDITSDTCGCINAIPPDGQYCQSVHNQNFTACPTTTASPTTVSTVPPTLYEYMIEIELNTTDFTVIDQLRAILRNASYPVRINNLIQITGINISTVCYPNGTGFQCRCEDQYRWSCDQCVSYGKCDDITSDTCGCINAIPPDGQYCQSVHNQNFTACPTTTASPTTVSTVPPTLYEYMIEIELSTTDVTVIDQLRAILRNASYPVRINNLIQITGINISTVCYPNGTRFQCRCEDQYRWSCDQCVSYGKCDDITSDTCGCINAIPPDGQYCQSVHNQNFTACPTTTASPTTVSTVPPTLYEYMIEIELNTTDVTVIDQLRAILRNASYPVRINNLIQITGINISTVCYPNGTRFQCRCEDQYRWSCDQCVSYGKCDDITSDTCGCINAIPPDGQYCQSVHNQNFTACPTTTASPTTVSTVPPTLYEYMIEIELNTTDFTVIDQLRAILRNASYPVRINNLIQITGINISTVCYPNGTGFQCRCEDQYRWSCDQCVSYGKCDDITSDTCGCINAIPPDGQYCQSVHNQNFTACPTTTASPTTVSTVPPTLYEYMIEIELNTTDVTVIDQLRAILRNASYPVRINNLIQITGINISTVCYPNGTRFQCRCEDQYRWSCDQCVSYGKCDDITSDTCGCINAIPPDGQYCQSVHNQNFTACPTTTASPTTVSTVPPTLYEYMIEIELNTTDITVIDQLRAILRNASYPVRINNLIQITGINISTVCYPNGTGFQCRCEDQYRWSCDQCVSYGKCDDITSDTCGCINAIPPDGQYCQSVHNQNFTACPTTTASPTTVSTVPPTLYEYMIEIELNTTDFTVIDQLRAILRNASYPVRINNLIQITGINISTVCYPNGTGFQCRCEDQYRWSCDQCVSYGKCDDITSDTCGCINAIPPDGQYCQSVHNQNFTACPTTTASPTTVSTVQPTLYEYMIEIELNTTDVTVIDQLRAILRNASYPVRINNLIQITGINISTVCYPNGTGFQCRCEDQYRWSCDQCVSYGKCDDITSDTCGCINAIPPDGQYCQSVHNQNFTACPTTTASPTTVSTVPPTLYEYMIEIELSTTDVTVIDQLRAILRNASYPVRINNLIQITGINISTVCYPNGTGFQCRCEDQYRWSCDQCVSYGKCDDITSDTCGCINAIPPDGQYCQSVHNQNFTACPTTTASPTTVSTVPPTLYEYMIEIELNTTDVTVIDQLRAILRNASYPVRINNLIQITGINISTVCYPNGTGFQCRCEDQYRWSCDQCVSYGKCDDITSDTCGCINAIPPDGQYCQSVHNQNFTACPTTTASPTTVSTVPPTLYEYMIEIELNTTDVTVIDQLRAILRNAIYPVRINNLIQITGINISTVCYPNGTGFQCRCEDQYRWSCDQCVSYGKCDDITSDTCGCINAIPPDGQYCQSVHNQNFTACPTTTASPTTVSTVPPTLYEYMIEIELSTTDVTVIDQLRAILRNASYPVRINNLIQITGINISTVCYPNGTGFQCRCEDQYRWSCDQCVSYGKCDDITSDTCGCINAIPPDGQYCQSVHNQNFTACPTTTASLTTVSTVPPTLYEYMIEIELNTTDVTVIDQLRAILRNASYPVRINNLIQITGINISTVCYPNGTGFQCRCEDQYRWSCDQCVSYGKCDDITSDTCGCINAIPPDGQYCQSVHNQNFTACPTTTASPTTVSTVPPTLYEYMIEIELNTTDVTVIDQLRAILRNASYPVRINNLIQITGINISTVCYPNGTGFQCRCEDQYRWSCDQCVSYGKCDDITSDTCGCINAIPPDGQYCQSVHNQNFTACPTTTASPTTVSTVPPTLYEYMIEIELNTTDVTVIDQLRAILRNASYPVRINNLIQITGINISTVCYPNGTGFQCRCEDQYRWSCDQCVSYGKCDDITSDTCGCINAIPPDGQYCQSVHNQNFTACPTTTASLTTVSTLPPTLYEYMIEIELNTTDVTVIDQLRAILRNASYPVRINNLIQITGINISTVCYPNGTGFQCRCEDQYRWSCDQCVSYGKCDDITSDTCGCINAIPPDGQYCQSVHNQNFTPCPTTTASPTTVSTVPPTLYEYMIEIELNTTDVTVIDQLRAILRNASYPVRINNLIQITGINISTVCYPNGTGFQCRCEDQYRWSCDQCVSYGKCDDITSDTCGCINAIPPDGQYCQSVHNQNFTACPTTTASPTTVSTVPPTLYEYMIEIELSTTDVTVIDQLRAILRNASYPVRINNLIQITGINISTVCYPNGTGFQCRCEDQYRWSCDQCVSYVKCDDITSDTCGCINAIPPDGQYCQSVHNQNFTACPTTTASPTTVSTVPPTLYEYMIEIELSTTDVTVMDQLRAILRNASYPVRINNLIQITGINISTVCYPNGTGFQCRCEDQYRWSCDQCVSYGKCDDITSDTCGCINAIPPDGQYCQSVHNQNFTACPTTTASPTTVSTVPPTLYEYMIEIELSSTDVTVIDQLRAILRNASYPVRINNLIQIIGINISTVCYPNGTGFLCRCEDQYRWSCDQCVSYVKCDDITSDTCGCINAIPPDGQYCQSVHNQNFTACPTTTASPTTVSTVPPTLYEYMIEIELSTTDVTVIDQLRAILRNASYPVRINNMIQITGINISTVCYPNGTGFQCRCEDQYRWSCDQCVSYGKCDDITSDTCGCINAIPPDGQYCHSVHNQNFTACPTTTASPTKVSTVPPTLYEYMIEIELNTTDVTVIDQLSAILRNASYPVRINNMIQISGINISTVCYPNGTGFQCRCEDQYRWSCDQCVSYGKCDDITSDTCGCINAIPPDGQYCQSVHNQNYTTCPTTTASPTTVSTVPPTLYEYMIEIELNTTDVTVIDQLRAILRNASYPVRINDLIQITGINISTVCYPNGTGFQCRCEDQYRWSCDQCVSYGKCDDIISDTCGCINAIPPDGQYCQSVHNQNFTACPTTTASPTTDYTTPEASTTEQSTTADPTTQLTTVTNSTTPEASTTEQIITADPTTQLTTVTNSTTPEASTTEQITTVDPTTQLTAVTNSTTTAPTTGQSHTADPTTQLITVTNSTTPEASTTEQSTTADPTTQLTTVTNSTTPEASTTAQSTTVDPTTQLTTVTNSTIPEASTTEQSTTADPTTQLTTVTNSTTPETSTTEKITTVDPTTKLTAVTNSTTPEASTTEQSTTADTTTQLTTVTNSTTPETSTTEKITTVDPTTKLTAVTNSTTPEASTTEQSTTADPTTQLTTVTNSTTPETSTTEKITTVDPTTKLTAVTNSTTPEASTTEQSTTADPTTQLTTVTNSTTHAATTKQITTADPTTQLTTVLNSTTPEASTTAQSTTVDPTTQLTAVTNSTTTAPTTGQSPTADPTTQLTTVTNSTIPEASTTEQSTTADPTTQLTTVTNSTTPEASTTAQSTTVDPTIQLTAVTNSTTTAPTIGQSTTTDPTTQLTTVTNSTTPEASTAAQSTTADLTTQLTTVTITTKSTPALTTKTTPPPPTTTTTITTTANQADILLLAMSFKMIEDFTSDLNDENSDKYKKYKGDIEPVIQEQYRKNMPGFISAALTSFSPGSVIVNCDVRTTVADPTAITNANAGVAKSLPAVYQVDVSSFNIIYNSNPALSYTPTPIYSGGTMTLECGPRPDTVNMGTIKNVEWKRKGRVLTSTGRFTIYTDSLISQKTKLDIRNVIADDDGKYECTLKSDLIYFYQMGQIDIKDAPVIQTMTEINIQCKVGKIESLECCVQTPYKLLWKEGNTELVTYESPGNCIKYDYTIQNCDGQVKEVTLTCQVKDPTAYEKTAKLTIFTEDIACQDNEYGSGRVKDTSVAACAEGEDGSKTAICESNGKWRLQSDTCVLTAINELLTSSKELEEAMVEGFLTKLSDTSGNLKSKIVNSTATISTIVDILSIVANISKNISQSEIKNILETVNVLVSDEAKESWTVLNADQNKNTSSSLLGSMELFAGSLPTKSFNVTTELIQLNQATFDNSFSADLNSSVLIEIPETNSNHLTITTLTFSSLNNVLPARNGSNQSVNDNIINGFVVLAKLNGTTNNVSLSFDKVNKSLTFNPQCVFWNFSLFNSLGGWDDKGCKLQSNENGTVTCHCNHLTSFSILMSTSIPKEIQDALDIITYVGVGISMGSLVMCLIIEACVWKAMTRNNTSYMRHVSIVNIAVSLLIADIWFIIGASIVKNDLENPGEDTTTPIPACTAATFFIHFFYLALFFWMLISGLLLFYRTIMVFSHMSKSTMLAIGFSVGYGAPFIIAVVTVAATAPSDGYIKENQACWLNWDKTMALLAFVIPALTIVVINFLILIVVLYKMLRRGVGDASQPNERNAVVVIARCLAILTPFFGLTWGLGVGTMVDPTNKGIHIVFALFNSLQGFFVLVFGTLLDGKIRSAIAGSFSSIIPGSDRTRSTNGGAATSSTSALNFFRRRIRRNAYNVSEAVNSSSSTGATESFINT